MAQQPQSDPIKRAFLHAFPNPDRIGCPGEIALRALVRNQLAVDHPASQHLIECSPCFAELLKYQAEWRRKVFYIRTGLIVAALLIAIISSSWIYRRFQFGPNSRLMTDRTRPAPFINHVPGVLNYQGISVKRGADSQPSTQPTEQVISRSVRELAIVLPTGREAGSYLVEIFPKGELSKPLARYTGKASIDAEGVTTLRTHVAFTKFAPGPYTVSWHVAGSEFSQSGMFVLR